ncbi:MAG: SDR family NAD(P)-dependent oxidoreductase [Acidobacteriota bacterium]
MTLKRKSLFWLAAAGSVLGAYVLARRLRQADLRGRIVLITGGSRGLGLLLVREFAREGARVSFCARDPEELRRAQADLESLGLEVYPVRSDVCDRDQVVRMIDDVTQALGQVDILVNNAGIMEVGPIQTMDLENFERAMDVMFWGPLHAIRAVLPAMLDRRAGTIVNITSIGGKISFPHLLPYCAAKFALVGLSEGLYAELHDQGIKVVTVVPGFMRTGSYQQAFFAGNQKQEFEWFALGASLPLISMEAVRAARQIVRAVKTGEPQPILSAPASLIARFHGLFPGATNRLLALVNHFLPAPQEQGFIKGEELQRQIDSTLFQRATTLGTEAAARLQRQEVTEA